MPRLAFRREGEGERVHRGRRHDEDCGQRQPSALRKRPVPREVRGDEGKREEAEVERVERAATFSVERDPEEAWDLDRHRCRDSQAEGDPHPSGPACRRRCGAAGSFVAGEDELFPEAVRMLAGELPSQGVDGAKALHRHEEGLVLRQPVVPERSDLLAEVVFQLGRVLNRDGLALAEVGPPCLDLFFKRVRCRAVGSCLIHVVSSRSFRVSCRRSATGGARRPVALARQRLSGSTFRRRPDSAFTHRDPMRPARSNRWSTG